MPKVIINSVNLDANEALIFARDLEHIKSEVYNIEYPEYVITQLIPVDHSAGPGAKTVTYREYDSVGQMKVMASYADDAPRSMVKGEEYTTPIKSIRGSYGYSIQDIRSAVFANISLTSMEAIAAREAYEETVDNNGWFADGSDAYGGLTGFLYNANTTKSPAPTGTWSTANPDEIIADVSFAITTVMTITLKKQQVTDVLLPVQQMAKIATTRLTDTGSTILKFIKEAWPGVSFTSVNELAGLNPAPSGGTAPVDAMVAYKKNPMVLQYQIPQPFEQFPPQERNLEFLINTHARIGNVIIYKPLAVHIVEGI